MRLVFDIDGVIMELVENNDYSLAKPNLDVVNLINELYEQGHEIILFTARGSKTEIDWSELTILQMENAGLKYHQLKFGKPYADFYIDDKNITINELRINLTKGKYNGKDI